MVNLATVLFALLALLASLWPANAQEAVFVIRHAEKQDAGNDPGLTEAGRTRAQGWAEVFSKAGVDIVLTTEAKRTRETGDIIATTLDVGRGQIPMADVTGLIDLLTFEYSDETVLIVGHTETIPTILSNLGIFETVEIDQDDYSNLFIVTLLNDDPNLVRLRMP